MIEDRFVQLIAEELALRPDQVVRTLELLDGGATIPFVARYRKDVTGNLDEVKLERIANRNQYFTALTDRRKAVLEAIAAQDKLTDDLRTQIEAVTDKTTLEDLYLPYKKKRRTKATLAREKGLEPLAAYLWAQAPGGLPIPIYAESYISAERAVSSIEEALEGARHILAEDIAQAPQFRRALRDRMLREGQILAHPTKNAEGQKTKYETYYKFSESASSIPSHRFLAITRGVKEGVLRMELAIDDEAACGEIASQCVSAPGTPFEEHILAAVNDAYQRLLRPSIENEALAIIHERADAEAIRVFRENAENLLLAPPAGLRAVIGVDPGLRTGCKLAVVDRHGTYLESATVYPTPPKNDEEGAIATLLGLMEKHQAYAIAIGNGTGAREASVFVRRALSQLNRPDAFSVFVNEAGASIYSASKIAREEFPELDVTVRGAISIARRLQDPLAELVKIEPRHVGVGQYQHDVEQKQLREGLHHTVVSCVNRVGVELNTASVPLLRYVSGIQANTAQRIVEFRTAVHGFKSREQLREVEGIGPKVFEQCAGFLRVHEGTNPLDRTGIHPEAYPIVERIADTLQLSVVDLLGNRADIRKLDLSPFVTELIGELTLEDIRRELIKPERDPRTEFKVPKFLDGVNDVKELEEGMESEGVVTNVTDFGAFVDIGVHQDGLVHLSELSNGFVRDPRDIVKVGDIVRVKVIKVDKELPRISLSMKALLPPVERPHRPPRRRRGPKAAEALPESAAAHDARQSQPPQPHSGRRDRPEHATRHDGKSGKRSRGPKPRRGPGDAPRPRPRPQEEAAINTLLADQLAALRDKFGN